MIGQAVDRYTLVEKLGSGGMGNVYKGHHQALDQYRAIKVLPAHLSSDPDVVERFLREARRCAALTHPNIVRLEHVGQQDGLYFMVMDFVPGVTLRELINRLKVLPPARAVSIARQLCDALQHAHDHHVIHRDVKPSNILVGPGDQVVLTDFGIARALESDEPGLTAAGMTVGTPEYMSPEQVRGLDVDTRADLYSLGVVLYEMLTGELPFTARSKASVKRQQVEKPPESLRFHNPELSPALEAVVLRALEKVPARRYPTAQEMSAGLAAAIGETVPVVAAPPTRVPDGPEALRLPTIDWDNPVEPESPTVAETPTAPGRAAPTRVGSAASPAQRRSYATPAWLLTASRRTRKFCGDVAWKVRGLGLAERVPPQLQAGLRSLPRPTLPVLGAGAGLALMLTLVSLQRLGAASEERFTAARGMDPRTGREYGVVQAHGVPLFVIMEPSGKLSAPQRAELVADRLEGMMTDRRGEPIAPEALTALPDDRGDMVLARVPVGAEPQKPRPEDVIVTVDQPTASALAGSTRTGLALWWRDLLRDHLRLAEGKPPASTTRTPYGKILGQVYRDVVDERRGGWVPPAALRQALERLPRSSRNALHAGWRSVPPALAGSGIVRPTRDGLVPVAPTAASASDATPAFPAARAIDWDPETAWEPSHGRKVNGSNHWLRLRLPEGALVSELHVVEGRRPSANYQLRLKQVKATFSDGFVRRLWRRSPDEPLRIVFPPRAAQWVRLEVEDVFDHRRPRQSHLYVSEVRLWGP